MLNVGEVPESLASAKYCNGRHSTIVVAMTTLIDHWVFVPIIAVFG
jgi:hypothetical protein